MADAKVRKRSTKACDWRTAHVKWGTQGGECDLVLEQ